MFKYLVACVVALCALYVVHVSSQDQRPNLPVSAKCLGCICEAISLCNLTRVCSGDVCGSFRITWGYWADGNKQTIGQQSPDEPTAYANCANDPYCAAATVQGYMHKFYQDCNGDNVVNCDDYAAIHALGGNGCRGQLPDFYRQRYAQCKQIVGNLDS